MDDPKEYFFPVHDCTVLILDSSHQVSVNVEGVVLYTVSLDGGRLCCVVVRGRM